ncbi:MAG TPA: ChbG/HpnK family deacetylase [Vicinamibacteria bacterium]
MTTPRRLIVNADDLGLHPGINAGIFHCQREGIVTSASICAGGAAVDEALAGVKASGLDLGVHLTLSGEAAVSPASALPTLAPEGRLPAYFTALFWGLTTGRIRTAEIERELSAQIERVAGSGVVPSHLDSHQHVHLHPALLPIVIRLARRFGVRALRAGRRVVPLLGLRPAALALFAWRASRRARSEGLRSPDAMLGVAESGRLNEDRLVRAVDRLPEGTSELICHPGTDGAAIGIAYAWGFAWDDETRALTGTRVREALARRAVQLVSYRDL